MAEILLHFTKREDGKAQCKNCPRIIVCSGSSTSGLIRHAESQHNIKITKRTLDAPTSSYTKKPPSILNFTKRQR